MAAALASLLTLLGCLPKQPLPQASEPEQQALSSTRLSRLTARMREAVKAGQFPGAVVLLARRGEVAYLVAFGDKTPPSKAPLARDSIFRLGSLTEPFIAVAVMMLAERGLLSIADPVTKYLPELEHLKVGVVLTARNGQPEVGLEPLRREMTIQDLLRQTSGLTRAVAGGNAIQRAYVDAEVGAPGQTPAEVVSKLSKLPLLFQPGTTWEYGMSAEVLGRLVEVVGGVPLDRFIEEQIARPLRLLDTGFSVPPAKAKRAVSAVAQRGDGAGDGGVAPGPESTSVGEGMVSTAADYARFGQMWLNGGELDGVRLLSRKTVELMTSNHLPPGTAVGPDMPAMFGALLPTAEMALGSGLGFAVRTDPGISPLHGSVGEISWGGTTGTYFWVDPEEKLVGVLLTSSPASCLSTVYLVRELAYQSLGE